MTKGFHIQVKALPGRITLGEEILAGRKFDGIGGNLIWRMQRNVNFGGNLIWRMAGKHIFWRELNLADKHKIECDKCLNFDLTVALS